MTFRQTHRTFLLTSEPELETMSEAESTALAISEVYSDYYRRMGGVGGRRN